MITIYNKIERSMVNTSGIQVISDIEYLKRPFLLCLSGKNNLSKSIYGVMEYGARAARILTGKEEAARFQLNEFPVDILGFRFVKDQKFDKASNELADQFLYPYLLLKGKDFDSVRKQARKINILAYGDAGYTYQDCEKRLEYLLQEDFSEGAINEILSQICLVVLQSEVQTGELYATSVAFRDINDLKLENSNTSNYKEVLEAQGMSSMYSPLGKSHSIFYIYQGSGVHGIHEFFDDSSLAKPMVSAVTTLFLENSLVNYLDKNYHPITISDVMDRLDEYTNPDLTVDELLDRLDQSLSYQNAPRYTEEMADLRLELDAIYRLVRRTNNKFIRMLEQKKGLETRLQSVIHGMDHFSSSVTFEQILTSANMWQPREGKNILNIPSDKEIRGTN